MSNLCLAKMSLEKARDFGADKDRTVSVHKSNPSDDTSFHWKDEWVA